MRILFNHALSSSELYTGLQDEMTNKSFDWFKANMGFETESTMDYLGHILTRAMDVIIEKVIREKRRFISPHRYYYIDFEIFHEDTFRTHRQRGRMQDIDIVNSGFTGYQVTLFYKNQNSVEFHKKSNIYLGKRHRDLFLEKVNNGEKMYSLEDFRLEDVIHDIHWYFPRMPLRELTRIVNKGLIRIYQSLRYGCYVSLASRVNSTNLFIGGVFGDMKRQWKDYRVRMIKKQQRINKWDTPKFNGYYYIGIPKRYMDEWYKLNNKTNRAGWKWVWFKDRVARRLFESTLFLSEHTYIFKIKLQQKYSKGWTHLIEGEQKYRDVEFIGEAIMFKFKPADKHWKDLIKEYNEERNS